MVFTLFSPDFKEGGPIPRKFTCSGADVSPAMGWFPVLTMWQVLVDMPSAGEVPDGYGHMYSSTANLRAWAAVTRAPGWTSAREAAISAALARS